MNVFPRVVTLALAEPIPGRLDVDARGFRFEPFPAAGGDSGDSGGLLLLPGRVNAHDHLHLNVFARWRGRPDYTHSLDWIDDMRGRMAEAAVAKARALPAEARAWHGAVKNAIAGATHVVHHDPRLPIFDAPDFPVHVAACGWAHSLDMAGEYGPGLPESLRATPAELPWYVHVAEGTDARAAAEVGRLATLGCLGPQTRLVHAVGLTAADRAAALAAGAAMVWCPSSNEYLLGAAADPSGFLPGRLMLGTDSRLTGSRDLLEEMVRARALGASASDVLDMTGAVAARLAGLRDWPGVGPDRPATDFFVVRGDPRRLETMVAGLTRAELRLVVVRGRPVIADADMAEVFEAAREPAVRARLDGRPKVVARWLVDPLTAHGIEEPGLEWEPSRPTTEAHRAQPAAAAHA